MEDQPLAEVRAVIPPGYNRRVTIQRRTDTTASDAGFGNAGVFTDEHEDVPCNIEQNTGAKAAVYDGERFTASGVARFPPNLDIRNGDRIIDGNRKYEIFRSHLVYASVSIPRERNCEWREVQI
jgi:hypothetical protein